MLFKRLMTLLENTIIDVCYGIKLVPKTWSLYLIILLLFLANILVWLNFAISLISLQVFNYLITLLGGLVIIIIAVELYGMTKNQDICNSSFAQDVSCFYVYYNTLNAISRLVDLLMIGLIIRYSLLIEMIIVIPLYLAICIWCILLYDHFHLQGYDLLQIRYFRQLQNNHGMIANNIRYDSSTIRIFITWLNYIFQSVAIWILKSKIRIFWIGSIVVLEPDIVTLLLRSENKFKISHILKITLPSNLICITIWSVIFYLGINGYKYFKWFVGE